MLDVCKHATGAVKQDVHVRGNPIGCSNHHVHSERTDNNIDYFPSQSKLKKWHTDVASGIHPTISKPISESLSPLLYQVIKTKQNHSLLGQGKDKEIFSCPWIKHHKETGCAYQYVWGKVKRAQRRREYKRHEKEKCCLRSLIERSRIINLHYFPSLWNGAKSLLWGRTKEERVM